MCTRIAQRAVSAMGPGNLPAVRVWPAKTGLFGSRTVQKPDPLSLGGPNPDPYPSTRWFCRVRLDPSVPMSGSAFRVFLFMVTFRYPTVNCKILTLGYHWLFELYWLPSYSKTGETPFRPNSKTERQQRVNDLRSCKSCNYNVIWSLLSIIDTLAAFIGKKASCTLPAPFWKLASMERQRYLAFHHGQSKCDVAVIVCIRCFDLCCRPKRSWTLGCGIVNETSCDCLGGCRTNNSCLSAYHGGQFLVYGCLRSRDI